MLDIYACSVGMIPTVQTRTFIVWMDIAKDVYRVRSLIEKNLPAVVLKSQKTAAHVFLGRPPSLSISIYYRKNIDGRRHYKKLFLTIELKKKTWLEGANLIIAKRLLENLSIRHMLQASLLSIGHTWRYPLSASL